MHQPNHGDRPPGPSWPSPEQGRPPGPVPGPAPRRRNPWVLPVAILGTLTLIGGVALAGGAAVWLLDPFGWRAAPTAQAGASETTLDPSLTAGGTDEHTFTYPSDWQVVENTEPPKEDRVYLLRVTSPDGHDGLVVSENSAFDGIAVGVCGSWAERAGQDRQPDIEIDGRPATHFQSREPLDTGEEAVRDSWCTEGPEGTMIPILGRSSGPGAADLEQSAAQASIDSWTWKD